jgi:hypothetical protein
MQHDRNAGSQAPPEHGGAAERSESDQQGTHSQSLSVEDMSARSNASCRPPRAPQSQPWRQNAVQRLIGPAETGQMEKYFEAGHRWKVKFIAKNFAVPYYYACNEKSLRSMLPVFYDRQKKSKPAILEIKTPPKKNAAILKSYFNFLKD